MLLAASINFAADTSNPKLSVRDIKFTAAVAPERLVMPPSDARLQLAVVLSVTNNSAHGFRFTTYRSFEPQVTDPVGRQLPMGANSNRSRLIKQTDCSFLEPGQTLPFEMEGTLYWNKGDLQLEFKDGAGGVLSLGGLGAGEYQLRFVYRNDHETILIPSPARVSLDRFWIGELKTPATKFTLVR